MNSFCALCESILKEVQFNFKFTLTEFSKIPLISVIEDINEDLALGNTQHLYVCGVCCELINEVDKLKIKLLEICNKLKRYIRKKNTREQNKNGILCAEISNNTVSEDVRAIKNEIHFSSEVETSFQENEESLVHRHQLGNDDIVETKLFKEMLPDETLTKKSTTRKKSIKKENIQTFTNVNHVKNDAQPFVCEICGQSYKQKSNFEIHMKIHKGINPFTCNYCNKSFTQKISLVRHLPLHTGDKPHQCETCGKRFIHHTSFINHKLIHTGIKSYKCSTCEESFRTSSHLKRHIRVHTGEKKFECTVCHRKFAEKYNLMVHHKLHIDSVAEAPRKRTHSCQICGETFERRLKLEEHKFKKHLSIFHDQVPEIEINV